METLGDLHWKIASLTVQKKILTLLLNTEKDRIDKRDVWDMLAELETNLTPSHHPKADEALTELAETLEQWDIRRKRKRDGGSSSRVGVIEEEAEGECESDFDEVGGEVVVKKFPRRRGGGGAERRREAGAAPFPVLDENPLDVAERIVAAVKVKKTVPKKDASDLRLVHECVRDVDIARYTHTVRAHYAAFASRPGVEDEVLAECLGQVDAFLVWLGKLRVPDCAQKPAGGGASFAERQASIVEEARSLARRCRPLHPQRRFLEVFDAGSMADSMCSPLLALLPVHEIFKANLEYEIPELSPIAHFDGVDGSFFTARRVDRAEVLWRADPALGATAKKLSARLTVYIRDLFVECFDRAYGPRLGAGPEPDRELYRNFDTRCEFAGPRLRMLMQNAAMCTRRGVQEVLQSVIGRQKARKISRVDRWCEGPRGDAAPDEKAEATEVAARLLRGAEREDVAAVLARTSPWIR